MVFRPLRGKRAAIVASVLVVLALALAGPGLRSIANGGTVSGRQFTGVARHGAMALLPFFRQLEMRHGIDPEAGGGLRLAVWPQRGYYLVSMASLPDGSGVGAVVAHGAGPHAPAFEREFRLTPVEARRFFAGFDERSHIRGMRGECLDGTGVQFERWTARRAFGGAGNADCQPDYAALLRPVGTMLAARMSDAPLWPGAGAPLR